MVVGQDAVRPVSGYFHCSELSFGSVATDGGFPIKPRRRVRGNRIKAKRRFMVFLLHSPQGTGGTHVNASSSNCLTSALIVPKQGDLLKKEFVAHRMTLPFRLSNVAGAVLSVTISLIATRGTHTKSADPSFHYAEHRSETTTKKNIGFMEESRISVPLLQRFGCPSSRYACSAIKNQRFEDENWRTNDYSHYSIARSVCCWRTVATIASPALV